MEIDTIESTCLFFSYIGLPFLILSWYMFIRLSREIIDKNVTPGFNMVYFVLMTLAFLAFGMMLVRRDALGDEKYNIIRRSMLMVYSGISLIVYGYSLIQLFLYTSRLLDIKERKNNRLFGLFYILFSIGTIILLNLAHMGPIFGFGFIILLFSIHLIPVFFQTLHLDKNFVESVRSPDFASSLEDFVEKYQISNVDLTNS